MKTEIKGVYRYSLWNRIKVQWHLHRHAILKFEDSDKFITCLICNKKLEEFIDCLKKTVKDAPGE